KHGSQGKTGDILSETDVATQRGSGRASRLGTEGKHAAPRRAKGELLDQSCETRGQDEVVGRFLVREEIEDASAGGRHQSFRLGLAETTLLEDAGGEVHDHAELTQP